MRNDNMPVNRIKCHKAPTFGSQYSDLHLTPAIK